MFATLLDDPAILFGGHCGRIALGQQVTEYAVDGGEYADSKAIATSDAFFVSMKPFVFAASILDIPVLRSVWYNLLKGRRLRATSMQLANGTEAVRDTER
jgi:hypothetical protein